MKTFTKRSLSTTFRWPALSAVALAAFVLLVPSAVTAQRGSANEHWVGTWATAEVLRPSQPPAPTTPAPAPAPAPQAQTAPAAPAAPGGGRGGPPPISSFNNQTLRQIVHTSIGGERVRVVLSNAFGTAPLALGGAHLALRDKESAIVASSARVLTFGGSSTVTIPAGSVVLSDAVDLTVPQLADLAIDLYLPGNTAASPSPLTSHNGAFQTNYVSPAGNHVGETNMPVMTTTQAWFLLSRVEVIAPTSVGAIVAFGDSITDGTRSTPDTNSRWPDHLAKRLLGSSTRIGVMNAGIAGNRILGDGVPSLAYNAGINALARFDRNALTAPGVTHIVVFEAINDIRGFAGPGVPRQDPTPTADDLAAGYRQLIERARAQGLRIYGATLTPFAGSNGWNAADEEKRQAVNAWIRSSKAYDAVIDFDAVVRDPNEPTKLLAQYDSGDHLHPSDAGYLAMANSIDLNLFKAGQPTRSNTR